MSNKHQELREGLYLAPLLMGSPWRTVLYFLKWLGVIVTVIIATTLFAGAYYFRVHNVSQQTALAIMAPVYVIAAVLTLLLYRSEPVLLAQGLGWRLRRIFLTYGLFVSLYLTVLHLASVIGWVTLALAVTIVAFGILSYPSIKAGAADIAATTARYAFVIFIFAAIGGASPAEAGRGQTARNALNWMPNASIVRAARPYEVYRKGKRHKDIDVTQTIT